MYGPEHVQKMFNHKISPQQQAQRRQQNSEVAKIAQGLLPSAVKWNDKFTPSRARGTSTKWKQLFKNKFVYSARLKDPWQQRKDWKTDMVIAANETVAKLCPNWTSNDKDRAMYNSIHDFAKMKTSPKREWLSQKAYAWLKWTALQPPQNAPWYPALTILVAYELFLSGGSGKLKSFMNILNKNKNQPQIKQLIQAHEKSMGTMGSCWMIRDPNCLTLLFLCEPKI